MASNYDNGLYFPTRVFKLVGLVMSIPRQEYSRNFVDFVTSNVNSNEHKSYRAGLIFLACIALGAVLIWSFFLMWLKLNAATVGCAAGNSFSQETNSTRKCNRRIKDTDGMSQTKDEYDYSEKKDDRNSSNSSPAPSISSDVENITESVKDAPFNERDDSSSATIPPVASRRERRTQVIFFTSGVIALVSALLALLFCFKRLSHTEKQSHVYLDASEVLIYEIQTSLAFVVNACDSSLTLIGNTSLVFNEICPRKNSAEIIEQLGVDIPNLFSSFHISKLKVITEVHEKVFELKRVTSFFDVTLRDVKMKYDAADGFSWMIPVFLLWLCCLISLAIFGVVLAWKRSSSQGFQFFLSYLLLPLLLCASYCCWLVAIALAITAAIGSDACMTETMSGSPNTTVLQILNQSNVNTSKDFTESTKMYISGCNGADPTLAILAMKAEVNEVITNIWNTLSSIDAIGEANLSQYCGGGKYLESFLISARDLAKLMEAIRDSLGSISTTLSCSRVSPIYNGVVNYALCTEATDAVSWGFISFLMTGISTMVMITLRASWLHEIKEDKIYDESEVAENMIVDEHEEYLRYISKYKHEWEEYQGVDPEVSDANCEHNLVQSGSTSSLYKSESDLDLTGTLAELGPIKDQKKRNCNNDLSDVYSETQSGSTQQPFDPYNITDSLSQSTHVSEDSISFLSLKDHKSQAVTESNVNYSIGEDFPRPLLLLRSANSAHEEKTDEESILLPPVQLSPTKKTTPQISSNRK